MQSNFENSETGGFSSLSFDAAPEGISRNALLRFLLIFGLVFVVYAVMAGDLLTKQSVTPHFVYLADAFWRGETHLPENLPSTYDLIRYENRWYVAQQPLPALLMMPLLLVREAAAVPDIFITVFLGALSVALCDFTLGVFVPSLSPMRRGLLTVFFALGTAHSWLSIMGTVWFMGQVSGTLFLWPFLLGMKWRWPVLAGLSLGLVALARPSIVPGALALYAGWWMIHHWPLQIKSLVKPVILFAFPFLLCVGFLGWYNAARFGSPGDFGYDYIVEAEVLAARRLEHGNFALYFFPENLYTATIRPPLVENETLEPDSWGMGLLLTSPVLLYLFFPPTQTLPHEGRGLYSKEVQKRILIGVSAIVILLPSLLYHNTGSLQFGYRFVLDALPLLMLLVGWGAQRGSIWLLVLGTVYSIGIHLWGIEWLYPLILGREWII